VLVNLLDNATKFTKDGTIRLEIARQAGPNGAPWVIFTVSDTGIGISPAQLKALFQPFPPSYHAARDRYSGAGLGLTITRLLCDRLGGRVEVESQPGQGSTFTVFLPEETGSI
jgi:signal transduction histidine kinase